MEIHKESFERRGLTSRTKDWPNLVLPEGPFLTQEMGVQSSSYQSTVASDECPRFVDGLWYSAPMNLRLSAALADIYHHLTSLRYLRKRHMTISFAGDAGTGDTPSVTSGHVVANGIWTPLIQSTVYATL